MSKSFKEDMERLTVQQLELQNKLVTLEEKWERVNVEVSGVEDEIEEIENKIKELQKEHEDEAFELWKKGQDISNLYVPVYRLTEEEALKMKYLEEVYGKEYNGAIGGGTTINITPTSLGAMISVTINGKEFSLTDYGSF